MRHGLRDYASHPARVESGPARLAGPTLFVAGQNRRAPEPGIASRRSIDHEIGTSVDQTEDLISNLI
jgi:hypothetical protein